MSSRSENYERVNRRTPVVPFRAPSQEHYDQIRQAAANQGLNVSDLPTSATRSDDVELVETASFTDWGAPSVWRYGAASDSLSVERKWEYFTDTLRLSKLKAANDSAGYNNVQSLAHTLDLRGNTTRRMDWRNSDQAECFEYDDLSRLMEAFTSDNVIGTADDCSNGHQVVGLGVYDHSYDYDSINNRTSVDSTTHTFGAGAAGPHALTSVGSTTFSYDDAGRQTSRTGPGLSQTLAWTPTGMAESVAEGSDITEFFYAAHDQRVLRVDPDGTKTIRLGDHFESVIGASTTITTDHYWFTGERIGMNTDDGTTENLYFVFTDRLGTTSVFYNHTTGGTITRQWFDPWGAPRADSGTPPSEIGYTGQHSDPTGLMDYGARLYDPGYATFVTPDTIVPHPANPQDLNRFAYVRDNPTTKTDPSGHFPMNGPAQVEACVYGGCWYAGKPFSPGLGIEVAKGLPTSPTPADWELTASSYLLDALHEGARASVASESFNLISVSYTRLHLDTGELCISVDVCSLKVSSQVRETLAIDLSLLPAPVRDRITPRVLNRIGRAAGVAGVVVTIVDQAPEIADAYETRGWGGVAYEVGETGAGFAGAGAGGWAGGRVFGVYGTAGRVLGSVGGGALGFVFGEFVYTRVLGRFSP